MQDIHSIGSGGGGRFFGRGDRRMRPHRHPNNHPQGLKCPRCASLNTKFCYYNNYNLSQPRHFCKSCRRYWTKGGVLRNVPVGGGCRKAKRAKQRTGGGIGTPAGEEGFRERVTNVQSSSSTDSSSMMAAVATVEEEPLTVSKSASIPSVMYNFSDSRFFTTNPTFDNQSPLLNQSANGQIFPTEFDGLASLIAPPSSSSEMMGFDMVQPVTTSFALVQDEFSAPAPENHLLLTAEDFRLPEMKVTTKDGDLTKQAAADWGSGGAGEHGLFDLTAAVDSVYWSKSQWTDSDRQ